MRRTSPLRSTGTAICKLQTERLDADVLASPIIPSSLSTSGSSSLLPSPTTGPTSGKLKTPVGVIVGPVVAVVMLSIGALGAFFWWRRRQQFISSRQADMWSAPRPYSMHRPTSPPSRFSDGASTGREKGDIIQLSLPVLPARRTERSETVTTPSAPPDARSTPSATEPPSGLTQQGPPSTVTGGSTQTHTPLPAGAAPPVDVNQLIELIAQRIDRTPHNDASPPQYPQY